MDRARLDRASQPRRWRDGVRILCYLVGGPGVTVSLAQVVDLVLAPERDPHFPEGAAVRMLAVSVVFGGILWLGRSLRRKA